MGFGKHTMGWLCLVVLALCGCGTTKQQIATEQLLASDAVDRSISHLDFTPLAGRSVFLDTKYIHQIKGYGFVNADYIISGIRQQLFAHRCLLQDSLDQAEVVVEARVGTLGNDGHEINYGLPSSNGALSTAATAVNPSTPLALLPEISLARRDQQIGAAKIAVFAYERETKEPLWQSGTSLAFSRAKQTWFLGAGPFQSGTIYEAPQLAGANLRLPRLFRRRPAQSDDPWLNAFRDKRRFGNQPIASPPGTVAADDDGEDAAAPASFQQPATGPSPAAAPDNAEAPPAPPNAGAAARLPTGGEPPQTPE